jgi:hypothetical protein
MGCPFSVCKYRIKKDSKKYNFKSFKIL